MGSVVPGSISSSVNNFLTTALGLETGFSVSNLDKTLVLKRLRYWSKSRIAFFTGKSMVLQKLEKI